MKKSLLSTLSLLTYLLLPSPAAAQGLSLARLLPGRPEHWTLQTFSNAIEDLATIGASFAGTVAIIYVIYGGLQYMSAAGDTGQMENAKKTITWAFIGLGVVISAWAIVKYFANITITNAPI